MLTETAAQVDDGWMSQAELARLKGLSRQAISKRLKRYVADGLISKDGKGRVRLAEWDSVTNEVTDPARLIGTPPPATLASATDEPIERSGAYTKERARSAKYDADMKEIALAKARGQLVDIDDVAEAMTRCAEILVRDIDQLPAAADDLATALSRNGVTGMREALKTIARTLRTRIGENMSLSAASEADKEEDDQKLI